MLNTCTYICFNAILIPVDIYCLFIAKPTREIFRKSNMKCVIYCTIIMFFFTAQQHKVEKPISYRQDVIFTISQDFSPGDLS